MSLLDDTALPDDTALTGLERAHLHGATGVIATVDADGYPHVVPLTVEVDGDYLVCNTGDNTKKVRHIRANGMVGLTVYGDPKWCVSVQGSAVLEPVGNGRMVIRIKPVRKISWGLQPPTSTESESR
jgi:hypothetical protein